MTIDLASLPNKTSLDGTEQLLLNDGGLPKDVTVDVLKAHVNAPLAAAGGSALVGYEGGDSVQTVLDNARSLTGYTELRAYTGRATSVRITSPGIAGYFYRDGSDTTSADNGGTIIVDASSRRWKRLFDGPVSVKWFGAVGDGVTDESAKVQLAINLISTDGGFVLVNRGIVYDQAALTIPLNVVLFDESNERLVFAHTAIQSGDLDSHITFRDIRPNNATRVYIQPNGNVSNGTLSAFKLFASDYSGTNPNYQDFGIYLSKKVASVETVDINADTVTSTSHPFAKGDLVHYETTGTAIGGLTADTSYYIAASTTNTFSLSSLAGGSIINLTSAGTGTQSFTQTTGYVNGKVNGSYPQYPITYSFQDGAQVGMQQFPINTGSGQQMHVALGGAKPSYGVWYNGVRIHMASDALFNNTYMLRWMNSTGDSAGFGIRLNSSNDLEFLSNSGVVASFLYNAGSPVLKLSKPYAHTRTSGTAGDTAPNVAGISFLQIPSNGSGYTITDFTNAIEGQELVILFSDGNATVQRSASMRLSGGVNFTGSNGATLTLIKGSSGWFEKGRSINP